LEGWRSLLVFTRGPFTTYFWFCPPPWERKENLLCTDIRAVFRELGPVGGARPRLAVGSFGGGASRGVPRAWGWLLWALLQRPGDYARSLSVGWEAALPPARVL